jgi:hypothetical protein
MVCPFLTERQRARTATSGSERRNGGGLMNLRFMASTRRLVAVAVSRLVVPLFLRLDWALERMTPLPSIPWIIGTKSRNIERVVILTASGLRYEPSRRQLRQGVNLGHSTGGVLVFVRRSTRKKCTTSQRKS